MIEYNRKCESPADHYRILIKDKDFNPELRINANVKKEGLADRQDLVKQFDMFKFKMKKQYRNLKKNYNKKKKNLKKLGVNDFMSLY